MYSIQRYTFSVQLLQHFILEENYVKIGNRDDKVNLLYTASYILFSLVRAMCVCCPDAIQKKILGLNWKQIRDCLENSQQGFI